jgi:proteasome lid subunit RPN8/RPN11
MSMVSLTDWYADETLHAWRQGRASLADVAWLIRAVQDAPNRSGSRARPEPRRDLRETKREPAPAQKPAAEVLPELRATDPSTWKVHIPERVLAQMEEQIRYDHWRHYDRSVETGGLLLAHYEPRLEPADAFVVKATGPSSDCRHWESRLRMDITGILRDNAELISRRQLLEVGLWHSHPDDDSDPSTDDLRCWRDGLEHTRLPYVGVIVTPGELARMDDTELPRLGHASAVTWPSCLRAGPG